MASAMLIFRQSARTERRLQNEAAGDASARARRQSAMDQHTQDFGATVAGVMLRLVHSAEAMRDAAGRTFAASEQTHASAAETADGATRSSGRLSAISTATEQMSVTVSEITARMREAAQNSGVATTQAAGDRPRRSRSFPRLPNELAMWPPSSGRLPGRQIFSPSTPPSRRPGQARREKGFFRCRDRGKEPGSADGQCHDRDRVRDQRDPGGHLGRCVGRSKHECCDRPGRRGGPRKSPRRSSSRAPRQPQSQAACWP